MALLDRVHGGIVHSRRVGVLARWLAEMIPDGASVLDVGCGDGLLAKLVADARPDVRIEGVDVLHHTDDPNVLLAEAARVARRCVVIKDHTRDGLLAGPTLSFMDWVGNARHGVALPYNYWPRDRWRGAIERLGMSVEQWEPRIGLYPWWARWAFERGLHFVARLGIGTQPGP